MSKQNETGGASKMQVGPKCGNCSCYSPETGNCVLIIIDMNLKPEHTCWFVRKPEVNEKYNGGRTL